MATILNVQFSDSTETMIVSYFGGPQNPAAWPNQGQIPSSDTRWATYYNSLSTLEQRTTPAPGD